MSNFLSEHRVFPRIFAIFYFYITYVTLEWFMALETPLTEQAGVVAAVTTASAAYFKFYVETNKS